MKLVPLEFPPGVFRRGTERQSAGRVYDSNIMRWYGKAAGPISGWVQRAQDAVTGKARAIIAWRDNAFSRWGAIGTHSKLYAFNSVPDIIDITPSDLTPGRADITAKTGCGYGVCGAGTCGTPRPDTGSSFPASVWDLDTWGENLVGCMAEDGRLLEWDLNVSNDAVAITNAPTDCSGLVVTPERALAALGADGNPRRVKWSALEDNTDWTPTSTNKAGEFDLQTSGVIMSGRRLPGLTLINTDLDAWVMQYAGGVVAYGFVKVGADCGSLSRRSVCLAGDMAVWWGQGGFYVFDGAFRQIECDVWEFLQENLGFVNRSKVTSFHNVEFNEVWWFYPTNGSEPDAYVYWKYPTANDPRSWWGIGDNLVRTCAVGPGVFVNPIALDDDGAAYDHETGSSYENTNGTDLEPYFKTGPMEIGDGDRVARVTGLIADEATSLPETYNNATVAFEARIYPNGSVVNIPAVTVSSTRQTDLQFTGRQVSMLVTFPAANDTRWGSPRLMVQLGGRK